jgi:long-chain acyl-CoA synthetase
MEERVWHRRYVPGIPAEVKLKDITIPEMLSATAKKFPNRVALIFLGKKITYKELDLLANRFAHAALSLGLRRGDRIALLLPNIPQIVIAYFGAWRARLVPVPINPLYTDREIEHQLKTSGAAAMVSLDLLVPRMLALRKSAGTKIVITAHIKDYLPFPTKQLFPFVKKGMTVQYAPAPDYYDFLDLMKHSPDTPAGAAPSLDDLALIPYSGGTTGLAKGVAITHRNVSAITQIAQEWFFDIKEKPESELAIFPFFHMAGFTAVMNLCVINGWTAILIPRPEPKTIVDQLLKYKSTIFLAVPTIYVGVLALPEFKKADLTFIKGFFSGAAPLPIDTINALREATGGASIVEGYGMTESTTFISVTPWRGTLKPGSVGVPLPNVDVKIVDIQTGTKELPTGQEGEIVFRGPNMCRGYYNMPEETKHAIRDGWFFTGDIGKFDEDGYLYIVDRTKDMIIAGGYNIFPREIDEVLFEHPKVLEACTIGVAHEYRGETVKSFIVVKPGEHLTEEELNTYCRGRLSPYKVPRIYEFVDSLPKSAVGKILKRELRDMEKKKDQHT